jgi:hypothetical protein
VLLATEIRFSLHDGTVIHLSDSQAESLYVELWSLVGTEPGALSAASRVMQARKRVGPWRRNSFDERESHAVVLALPQVDCS